MDSPHCYSSITERPTDFIPKDAYVSPEFARLEKERLWPTQWLLACREEDITKPRQFVTFEIADESIIITRDNDRNLHAYFNVCPHRGRRLLEGCGQTARFFCRFHGWQWKLDGSNHVMMDGDDWQNLSPDDIRLKDLRVDIWARFVFVNIDGKAEPLLDYLSPWPKMWETYRMQDMRYRWFKQTRLNCNWKVALEAFLEGYHAQTTHRQVNAANGSNLYACRLFGRHSMFYDRVFKKLGTPNPNGKLLPPSETDEAAPPSDPRKLIAAYIETVATDLGCQVTEHMVEAARRLPERVEADADHIDVMRALRNLHVEIAAEQGVRWDHLPMEDMQALGVGWHMFPNIALLATPDGLVMYRARPDGDDPDTCLLEIFPLQRYAPGAEPKVVRELHEDWRDGDFPKISGRISRIAPSSRPA
jgi:nitrite reductase/ring-hydroxylating ferredoxin subunit